MKTAPSPVTILIADDDEDDRQLTGEALRQSQPSGGLRFVRDGQDLLDYLHGLGPHAGSAVSPRPSLILLDLNMPRMDGREALAAIKSEAGLRSIPIVVLTTSRSDEDVCRTYDLGVNSFISKPATFAGLVAAMQSITRYWFELVELPAPVTP